MVIPIIINFTSQQFLRVYVWVFFSFKEGNFPMKSKVLARQIFLKWCNFRKVCFSFNGFVPIKNLDFKVIKFHWLFSMVIPIIINFTSQQFLRVYVWVFFSFKEGNFPMKSKVLARQIFLKWCNFRKVCFSFNGFVPIKNLDFKVIKFHWLFSMVIPIIINFTSQQFLRVYVWVFFSFKEGNFPMKSKVLARQIFLKWCNFRKVCFSLNGFVPIKNLDFKVINFIGYFQWLFLLSSILRVNNSFVSMFEFSFLLRKGISLWNRKCLRGKFFWNDVISVKFAFH